MKEILLALNVIFAIIITILILLQGKGGGLGSAWGGGGEQFQTRRGIEKVTLRLTVLFIILFLISSVWSLFLK
jgi:protein translocase SecG subunit